MIPLVKKILSGRPNPHIDALSKALEKNASDYAFAASLRTGEAEDAFLAKLEDLKRDPENPELLAQCLAIGTRRFAEQEARTAISAILGPHIHFRVQERTKKALKPALSAIVERLEEELGVLKTKDEADAARYDIAPRASAAQDAIASALREAKGFLEQVDGATVGTLPGLVTFAMDRAK